MRHLPEWIREANEYERRAPARPIRVEPIAPAPPVAPRRDRTARAAVKRRSRRRFRRMMGWVLVVALLGSVSGALAQRRLRDGGGDVPFPVWTYALLHGIDVREYPQSLLELYKRNPETKDFVLHYPKEHGKGHEYTLTPDGGVPLYLQWDERWGYESYNGDLLALTGCGPCCLAMAATYLTGDVQYDPLWVSRWAQQQGYAVEGAGTSWTLFSEGAEKLGLDAVEIGAEEQRVRDNLAVGNVVVCVMGPGDFTTEGHFILLTDYDDGFVTVRDPNSRERSEKSWCFADISDQMLALWVLRTAA